MIYFYYIFNYFIFSFFIALIELQSNSCIKPKICIRKSIAN
jgi:hypothetical protein